MFNLFAPVELALKAPRWASRLPNSWHVFGTSPFADLFLCSPDESRIAVLSTEYPEMDELSFDSIPSFRNDFLVNENVVNDFFRKDEYALLVGRLGQLREDECFFPVPYRALGGDCSLLSYDKGDVWVHLDLYAQVLYP